MGVVVAILLCIPAGSLAWRMFKFWSRHVQARWVARLRMLSRLSSQVGIDLEWDEEGSRFIGTAKGRAIEYQFTTLGVMDGITHYATRARLDVPTDGLEMDLQPRSAVARVIGRRRDDLKTGDDAFDRVYELKATPGHLAKELLDAEARQWLLAQRPARLRVQREGLLFEKAARLDGEGDIRTIVSALVRLAERLVVATRAAGYRGR
jgi:hypothetical protein